MKELAVSNGGIVVMGQGTVRAVSASASACGQCKRSDSPLLLADLRDQNHRQRSLEYGGTAIHQTLQVSDCLK